MLLELSIQNIALIERLQLRFGPGLSALTGETGAGKSIILDALGLLLGNRASSEMIRRGADVAFVEGLFSLERAHDEIAVMLSAWGIPFEERHLVVVRELHVSGRTTCRLNGRIVTVQMLRQLGHHLVQQQGQHDHQGLLRSEEQLHMLDLFAQHDNVLQEVRRTYELWQAAHKILDELRMDEQEQSRELDMLQFQINEIEQGELQPGEEEPLREERRMLQHVDRIASYLELAVGLLDGDSNQLGATARLSEAVREVTSALAYDDSLRESLGLLETAQVHAEEASRALFTYLSRAQADPQRIDEIESRFGQIRSLERKYGANIEDVLAFLSKARDKRDQLLHYEERSAAAAEQVVQAERKLQAACQALHDSRSAAATELAQRIQNVLRQLDIPSADFTIHVERRDSPEPAYGPLGFDAVVYLFSANRGEESKPLSRIASGGELSRTLLAMKSVLSEVDEVDTLVFDEIDTGVSGSATTRIAEQLEHLGTRQQVLCVTHSAQIAASAKTHWEISKDELSAHTSTRVTELDECGRVREIARLLGSEGTTNTAQEHARALLQSRKHVSV